MNLAALMKKFLIPLPMDEAMLAPIEAWQGSAMAITTTRVQAKPLVIAMIKVNFDQNIYLKFLEK